VPTGVVMGFTAGIAVVIFFGQLNGFLGIKVHGHAEMFHEKLGQTFAALDTIRPEAVAIGFLSLAILIGLPFVNPLKKVPPSLLVVVVTVAIVQLVPGFERVTTISKAFGEIPAGLPKLATPVINNWIELVEPSMKTAFLIAIESLLCAVVADKLTKGRHMSNTELLAQGLGNIASGFFGGIPATAVIARTGTAIKSGSTSRVASIVHALVVIAFLGALTKLGSLIPIPALAAILFVTAYKISEYKEVFLMSKIAPRSDFYVLLITFLLTVFVDLTVAVGFGMIVALLLMFKDLSGVGAEFVTSDTEMASEKLKNMLVEHKEIAFVNLEGNLCMGCGVKLREILRVDAGIKEIVVRMREIQRIDLSGLEALKTAMEELHERHIKIVFTSINPKIEEAMRNFGLIGAEAEVYKRTGEFLKSIK
jgi:SulP family sulfate permease